MRALDLQSEPFSATGSLASEGARNQLGRPDMDRLSVLIREAVQNSWDARLSDDHQIRFEVSCWSLSTEQVSLLRDVVFKYVPPRLNVLKSLLQSTSGSISIFDEEEDCDRIVKLQVLAISDRGTTGLGGPTRADIPTQDRDFVNFLRNVGQPRDKDLGGGTYGYGKTAFYLNSLTDAICVYTHCSIDGKHESRFICAALGDQYSDQDFLYTGRHWWGVADGSGFVEPVEGELADEIASGLGMPGFSLGERGTTVMILLPDFEKRSSEQAMNHIAAALLWNFWPKMVKNSSGWAPISFNLFLENQPLNLPSPEAFPPLHGFVQAMKILKTKDTHQDALSIKVPIRSLRPKQHLGFLSLVKFAARKPQKLNTGEMYPASIQGPISHVALMRQAELVVKYLEGPKLLLDGIEYAGVFVTDPEVDSAFANSEPPTHDNWEPASLKNPAEKTYVNVALRNIKSELKSFTTPAETSRGEAGKLPLGAFAEALGGLLLGLEGPGASIPALLASNNQNNQPQSTAGYSNAGSKNSNNNDKAGRKKQGNQARPRLSIRTTQESLRLIDDQPVVVVDFELELSASIPRVQISAVPTVVILDGQLENEAPKGGEVPKVLQWLYKDGRVLGVGSNLFIKTSGAGRYTGLSVVVSVPDSTAISVLLKAEVVET